MGKDGVDTLAALAFYVNVVAVGSLHDSLKLVGALLVFEGWVEEIVVHKSKRF